MSEIISDLLVATSIEEIVNKLHLEMRTGILVSKVTQKQHYILALDGLELPDLYQDVMPINLSICQHTVAMDFPLVVNNTIIHPLLRDNRAFAELNIVSYLGAPIHDAQNGHSMGTICAVDQHQRLWEENEIAVMVKAAQACERVMRLN